MQSITVYGLHDPQMTGTLQDDPEPALPGRPLFWDSGGGFRVPEEVGKPLYARLPSPTPAPQILYDARDVSGYDLYIFNEDTLDYTTLEGVPLPGPAPVLTALSTTSAAIGGPDVLLRVDGTGFSRGAQMTFNGGVEATTVVGLETTINMATATTPGEYPVTVRNPDGQESAPLMFEITEPVSTLAAQQLGDYMALANIYRVVQDLEGNVVTGVLGTVTISGTATLASLFSDAAGTIPLPNPTTNNAQFGSFSLFLPAGTYDMQFVKAGFTFQTQTNITLRDPAAGVNTITGTANRVIVAPVPGVGAVTLSTPQDIAPDSNVQFRSIGVGTPPSGVTGNLNVTGVANLGSTITGTSYCTSLGIAVTAAYPLQVNGNAHFFGGTIGIGTTPVVYPVTLKWNKAVAHAIFMQPLDADTSSGNMVFANLAGSLVGSIFTTATTTAFNTTSDARLKTEVQPLTGALDVVRRLRPIMHRWRADGSRGTGFLAHEVQEVLPDGGVVTGTPDAVDANGQVVAQGMDPSKLVVWLVGAIQEIVTRLETLEARV